MCRYKLGGGRKVQSAIRPRLVSVAIRLSPQSAWQACKLASHVRTLSCAGPSVASKLAPEDPE
eukprot:4290784-Alexandrium_andersonii.AAC.1